MNELPDLFQDTVSICLLKQAHCVCIKTGVCVCVCERCNVILSWKVRSIENRTSAVFHDPSCQGGFVRVPQLSLNNRSTKFCGFCDAADWDPVLTARLSEHRKLQTRYPTRLLLHPVQSKSRSACLDPPPRARRQFCSTVNQVSLIRC